MASMNQVIICIMAALWGQAFIPCSAQEELFQLWNWIFVDCAPSQNCALWCIFEKMGIVDGEQYQSSKMFEWLKFTVDVQILTEDEAKRLADVCDRVNDVMHQLESDCDKSDEVRKCLSSELYEITYDRAMYESRKEEKEINDLKEKWNHISNECSKTHSDDDCKELCLNKEMGIIDENGLYVESKQREWMRVAVYDGLFTKSQADHVAAACNRVNRVMYRGCKRGVQVAQCIATESSKEKENEENTGPENKEMEPGLESFYLIIMECRNMDLSCLMWCFFLNMGILSQKGQFDEHKLLEWMDFPVDMKLLTETQANRIAEECYYRLDGNQHDDLCERGRFLWQCLNTAIDMVLQNTDGKDTYEVPQNKDGKDTHEVLTYDRLMLIDEYCRKNTNETCLDMCKYEKLGIINERGWFVESKMAELEMVVILIAETSVPTYFMKLFGPRLTQLHKTCNHVTANKPITDCHQANELRTCVNEEVRKIGNEAMEEERKIINECRRTSSESCDRLCTLKKMNFMNENAQVVESEWVLWIRSLTVGKITVTEAEKITKACDLTSKHITDDCRRVIELENCIVEKSNRYKYSEGGVKSE